MRKNGIVEEWNDGLLEGWKVGRDGIVEGWKVGRTRRIFPRFQYSIIPVLLLLLLLLVAGCGRQEAVPETAAQKPAALVQVAKAETRDLEKTMTFTGSVEPVKVARMASPAEGPVVECSIREGDHVAKGQMLARVGRSRIAETGLEAALEELRRQEAEYQRIKQLVSSGSLAGEQVEQARSNLRRAEAQVAAMETGAGDYEIKAPWDGVVSRVWISEGNYVSPRAPLVELFDPATLIVRVAIPERQAFAVTAGLSVHLSLDAYPAQRFKGKVTRIYPELERTTRTLTAEVELLDEVQLLSGMFARLDVVVQTARDAVVVPESALVVLPGGGTILFVKEGDNAVRRTITTGLEAGGFVAIETGIQAGGLVITRGNESLKDGAPVRLPGSGKPNATPPATPAPPGTDGPGVAARKGPAAP